MGIFKKAIRQQKKQRRKTAKVKTQQNVRAKQRSPLKMPFLTTWRRIKRVILWCSVLLFAGFVYAAYTRLAPATQSTAGKLATSGAGWALSPVVASLPWWFWGGFVGIWLYLWLKHKLVMSVVSGVVIGVVLAVV